MVVNKLPARPGRTIMTAIAKMPILSVTPWDSRFPMKKVSPKPFVYTVNPWNSAFPMKLELVKKPIVKDSRLPSQEEVDVSFVSLSPWDCMFPKSSLNPKRKSRNRSQINKRHRVEAMLQYKKEHGPVAQRTWEVKPVKTDYSFISFSPWQETEFAKKVGIPIKDFVSFKKLKNNNVAKVKPDVKSLGIKFVSVSPFNASFPKSAKEEVKGKAKPMPVLNTVPAVTSLMARTMTAPPKSPTAPIKAAAFPAISPMHKKHHDKRTSHRKSLDEEAHTLAEPFLSNRFIMGVI